MSTYSSNTTIKIAAAIDGTSFATTSTQYAEVSILITTAGGTITHTGGVVTTLTALNPGIYNLTLGPAHTIACTNGRVTGAVFTNTP